MENTDKNVNKVLGTALWYLNEAEFSVIPVGFGPDGKAPMIKEWKRFQESRASVEQVRGWFSSMPDAKVAIITGKISGIVVIDVDCDKGGSIEGLPRTSRCRTGNGYHFYYKHPGVPVKTCGGIRPGIDIRGDGGYVIAPPSMHKNGKQYTWEEDGLDIQALADLPEWTYKEEPRQSSTSLDLTPRHPTVLAEKVVEGARNNVMTSQIGRLLHYLPPGLRQDIFPIIQLYNKQSFSPPLDERELQTIFKSVSKMEDARRSIAEPIIDTEVLGKSIVSLKELCERSFPAAVWAIEDLFEAGTLNMISAAPNQYKSWIVAHMAICLAKGEPLFGRFKTTQQGVMIVNGEDPLRQLRDRLVLLLEQHTEDLPIYLLAEQDARLTQEVCEELLALAKARNVGFIVFDSLRSLNEADENSSKEMQDVMNLLRIFTRAGLTVLFTHHNRKKPTGNNARFAGEDIGEEIRGSTAINGAVHGHLSCEPMKTTDESKKIVIRQQKLKVAAKINPFVVSVIPGTDSFELVYDGEFSATINAEDRAKAAILRILEESDKWFSVGDLIAQKAGGDRSVRSVLRQLALTEQIDSKTKGALAKEGAYLGVNEHAKHNALLYKRKPRQMDLKGEPF